MPSAESAPKPRAFDYRLLLRKYMQHVGEEEGTHFLGRSAEATPTFSPEELVELRRISAELDS